MTRWFTPWRKKTGEQSLESLMLSFAKSADRTILEALIERAGNDLYHYVLSQTDPALAADICQSSWLKVIEKRQYFRDSGSFKAWLFTIARNQMLDNLRHDSRWQSLNIDDETNSGATPADAPEQTILQQQAKARFNELFEALPFLQKEAYILQQEGFSLQQIAQITGEGSETIKTRLRYARQYFDSHLNTMQEEAL